MDRSPHWITVCKCNGCGEMPDTAPLYQCPLKHQYCQNCYKCLQGRYQGDDKEGCICAICNYSGRFEMAKFNTDFLRKLKTKPGIGRPFRYNSNPFQKRAPKQTNPPSINESVTVEDLFQMPSDDVQKLLNFRINCKNYNNLSKLTHNFRLMYDIKEERSTSLMNIHKSSLDTRSQIILPPIQKPVQCPHKTCGKMVTSSAFVNHFRRDHGDVQKIKIGRGEDLIISFDATWIEHKVNHCIAMITVYEVNKIEVTQSRSSQSVIETCQRFSKKLPIDTFWLMVSGLLISNNSSSSDLCAYSAIWMFTSSENHYRCTIELASKSDRSSISTFCNVQKCSSYYKNSGNTFAFLTENMNCMLFCETTIIGLLNEGPELNLRIVVH